MKYVKREKDFFAWAMQQAYHIRDREYMSIDIERVSAEIAYLARTELKKFKNTLESLIVVMLKWHFQPKNRNLNLQSEIHKYRKELRSTLKDSPSMGTFLSNHDWLHDVWLDGIYTASINTDKDLMYFPEKNIWSIAEILDYEFFPEPKSNLKVVFKK